MAQVIAPDIGGGSGPTKPYASISGISPSSFDVYTSAQKSSMYCSLSGANKITITNPTSGRVYLYGAIIYVNGVEMGRAQNVYTVGSSNAGYSLGAKTLEGNSSVTFNISRTGNTTTFSSSGAKLITVILKIYTAASKYLGRDPNGTQLTWCSSLDINGGYVYAFDQTLYGISVSGGTREFYKNGTFNYSGLSVSANYKYFVDGNHSGSTTISSGYSVSTPSLASAGTKTVTVTYSGRSTTYNISVYGVKSYTKPTFSSNQKIFATQPSLDNVTVTYDDNSTSSESVSVSGWNTGSSGEKTITYSFTASKTGETFTYTSKINVYDYTLVLDTTNIEKLNYAYNATSIDTTGLIIKKVYGNGLTDDPVSVDSCSFAKGEWDTGKDSGEIVATYNDDTSKTASYRVNVNGLAYITLDTSEAKISFGKSEPFTRTGVKVYYTEWEDGVTDDKGEWTGAITQEPQNVSTDNVGNQNIELSITKNGKTVSESYQINVFEHNNITLTNVPNEKYIVNGANPTLSFGDDFKVSVKCDDGENEWDDNNPIYDVSPAIGSTLSKGTNTITLTTYYSANKLVAGATTTFDIVVQDDYPKEDTTITVEGIEDDDKIVYLKGQTVDLRNLIVKVDMLSGLIGATFDDYDVQLVLHSDNSVTKDKNDLTFNNGDTLGYYDLVISIEGVMATATIENAVCFKGVTSITYNENGGYGHGYYINGTRVGLQNRVKIGDAIDLKSIKFRLNYSDNTHEDIFDTDGIWLTAVKINNVAKTYFLYADRYGIADYFILDVSTSLGGTINVSVPFLYLDSITITNTKTSYDIHDQLDLSKITITKNYVGDSSELYEYTKSEVASLDEFTLAFSNAGTGCSINDLTPESTRQSASVTLSLSKQEGDYTGTTAGTTIITVKALRGVTLVDNDTNVISKFAYKYGQRHNLNNCFFYITFNTNQTQTIAIADNLEYEYKNSVIATDTAISTSISYTYHNDTKTYNYDIHCHYLSDITVDFSSVTGGTLYQHDTLDVSDIAATATINSTDEEDTDYPMTPDITDDLQFAFNGQNVDKSVGYYLVNTGTFNLVASYNLNGQVVNERQALTIVAVILESISLTKALNFKDLEDYVEEQNLSLVGLTVDIVYNKTASNHSISYTDPNVQVVDGDGNVFNKTKELDLEDAGTELLVKYTENGVTKYASIGTLDIAAKELDHLNIRNNPTKVNYYYGDSFSIDGMVVEAVFNNGKSEVIANSQLTITDGVALGHTFNPSDDGTTFEAKSVTFSYTHSEVTKTKNLSYNLLCPVLALIKHNVDDSSEPVKKRFTDGDTFDSSGLVVTAVMTNGYEIVLTNLTFSLDATALCLDGSNKIQLHANDKDYGSKTLIITGTNPYNNNESKTTSYDVEVTTSGAVVSAIMQIGEGADLYLVGEEYSAKGVSFKITDIDGNVFNVTNFTTDIEKGTIFRSASRRTVKVTYTNGDYTKTEEYSILVSVPNKVELTEENTYQLAVGLDNGTLFTTLTDKDNKKITFGKQYDKLGNLVAEYYPLFHENKVSVDDNPLHTNTFGYNVYTGQVVGAVAGTPLAANATGTDGVDYYVRESSDDGAGYLNDGTYRYEYVGSGSDITADVANKYYPLISLGHSAENDCVGYIDLGIEGVRNAHIVLFDDPVNPIDGNGNIEVIFPHYVEGYADRINHCQFGRIFHNRLFVAGNPNFRNCDWHSGDVNVGQLKENYDNVALHDLTYFSDLDYCYYGNQETAIVGYDQYRDGDLIVIKEGSRNQATIYRREYKLVEATAYNGSSAGENLLEEAFPMFDVNSNGGVGGLSHRSIANFVGETLVLTKDGLKAITNKENAYGNMKFTYDVSTYINPAITKEDLANGILYSFGEKLLLKTNRGLYVGYNELRNDTNEYEWYFLNNIEADLFFAIDDELYFANDNGEVFRFPLEEFDYKDKTRTFIGVGGTALTISESNDTIVVSSDYASKVKENAPFHLITKYTVGGEDVKSLVHASLGNFVYGVYRDNMINGGGAFDQTAYNGLIDWESSRIILKPFTSDGAADLAKLNRIKNYFYDGRKVYLDLITSPNPKVNANVAYYLKYVDTGDFGDIAYELEDEYGNKADLSEIITFRLSFAVNHLSITKMTDIKDYGESGAKQFKLIGDHDQVLDLINYNNESYSYAGVITNEDNVKAYFETAPYAMGSIVSLKTIWSWTIVNDTALAGYMDVGFFASRKQGDYDIAVKSVPNSNGFDFSNYSFATVEFLNRKLPATYGRQRTVPSVAFIRYLFKNFEDSNMVLTTLNVVYTVANFLKGVK